MDGWMDRSRDITSDLILIHIPFCVLSVRYGSPLNYQYVSSRLSMSSLRIPELFSGQLDPLTVAQLHPGYGLMPIFLFFLVPYINDIK